ncbi:MAG: hypothetical protein ABI442_18500 [Gemmatimonadaceae bacterium]
MKTLYSSKVLVSAATLIALGSSVAFAQDSTRTKPRSTRRIPISKEAPGEVANKMKTDTVMVYRTDTLRLTQTMPPRVDTVRTTSTVMVHDTVTMAPMMKPMHLPGGLYFGVGGGVSAPNGSIYNPNNAGPTAQAQLGWEGAKSLLGLRIDGNWTKPGEDALYSQYQADPDVVNLSGDVKLNLPFFHHLFGMAPRFKLYGIGGGSYILYKDLPIESKVVCAACKGPANVIVGDTDWQKHFGWNAGGGASIGWNRTEIFAEARVIAWTTDVSRQARQIPFVLGINLF